ncbi:MAG: hypothetical protein QXF82_09590 [Nitrososphaeria archaeon]
MGVRKIFPKYPLLVASPRGCNIKIASRRLYVDFPYIFWNFIGYVIEKIDESESPQEIFKKELELFNSDEEIRKITTFNGVPLGAISLTAAPFTTKLLLKLKVNWPLFLQYLESRAQELTSKVEVEGSNIREVYNEILGNYFKLVWKKPDPRWGRFNIYELEKFKKLLRKQKEEQDIQLSLSMLKQTIKNIEEARKGKKKRLSGIELWALQLETDLYAIEECLENVDILSCYFYLRNMLENLIKLIVYDDIAKNFNNLYDEMLRIFFFYEKIAKDRCYNIKQIQDKYVKKITSYLGSTSDTNLEDLEERMYQMMIEKQFSKLSINSQTLEEFQKLYNITSPIKNYWSACSEILHNQSPLPFFSLLEIKYFKHFLRRYSEHFVSVSKIISPITKEVVEEKIGQEPYLVKQELSKNARLVFRQLLYQKEKELKTILKTIIKDKTLRKKTFFDPLTLVSLFYLYSPTLTHISSRESSIDDIYYIITKIQPLRFGVKESLKLEFYTTLRMFEEKMIPKLEQISSEFSKLNKEEKKVITFYLISCLISGLSKNILQLF